MMTYLSKEQVFERVQHIATLHKIDLAAIPKMHKKDLVKLLFAEKWDSDMKAFDEVTLLALLQGLKNGQDSKYLAIEKILSNQ